jgi:hypothetical protein
MDNYNQSKPFLIFGALFTILSGIPFFMDNKILFTVTVSLSIILFLISIMLFKLHFNEKSISAMKGTTFLLSIIIYMFQTTVVYKYIFSSLLFAYFLILLLVTTLFLARANHVIKIYNKFKRKKK